MSDLITTIPADEYLNLRRRVDASSKSHFTAGSEFAYTESATVNVVEGFPAYLRSHEDRPTTVAVMLAGHTYDDDDLTTPVSKTAHANFTPEQAEALAHTLILAAAEAREVEASIIAPEEVTA